MPNISTVSDNFNDNAVNTTLWAGNYGTPSETGGRARVPVGSGFSAYSTGAAYTLDRVTVRAYPQAANGGASSFNYSGMWFVADSNNRVGIFVDSVTTGDQIYFQVVTAGSFSNQNIAYNATNHAYWDITRSGSNVLLRTSPDGINWTTQRTAALPTAVANTTTGYVILEGNRSSGTANFAEFDDFNILPTARTPVTRTWDLLWGVRGPVARTWDLQWAVRGPVARTWDIQWAFRTPVARTWDVLWGVRGAVTRSWDVQWAVRQAVTREWGLQWAVRGAVTRSWDLRWAVRGPVSLTFTLQWSVRAGVVREWGLQWSVRSGAERTWDLLWSIDSARAPVGRTWGLQWGVRGAVVKNVELLWGVRAPVSRDWALVWGIRQSVTRTTVLLWAVRGRVLVALDLLWAVQGIVARTWVLRWSIESETPSLPLPADVVAILDPRQVRASLEADKVVSRLEGQVVARL